ncbi:zinc finger protein 703 isoform X2 [Microtus oregoni]|uniref:zinc finger protein 703 isoform X2 n=1 Tax=Microtus oregoni TaxID=111838 RepID=UPI001BB1F484|nr:zinc finger protein 703 isoform X2 [Microtus oregoni]
MSDSPAGSNPRTPESSGSGGSSGGGGKRPAVPAVVSLLPPADPLRQANRLPIRVLKMLSAHTGHLLHPEYLQPLSSTPVSPIERERLDGMGRIATPTPEKSPLTRRAGVEPFLLRASAHDTLRD